MSSYAACMSGVSRPFRLNGPTAVGGPSLVRKNYPISNPPAEKRVGFLFAHGSMRFNSNRRMNQTQTSLTQNLRALPRGAWILFFGTFLNKFGTFVLPFLAIYMTGLGYTAAQAGLAVGAYGIGTLCAAILGGYLADRLGRRKTIMISMFGGAIAMLCLSQAQHL